MVTRKDRAQTRTEIRDPATRTYEAQPVTHVGPQRKQSEASNYERLARDLGQFNNALQGFGRSVDSMLKRREAEAKKLEAEKKAAERRKKAEARRAMRSSRRRSSGGRRRRSGKSAAKEEGQIQIDADKDTIKIQPKEQDNYEKHRQGNMDDEVDVRNDPGYHKEVLGDENITKKVYKNVTEAKQNIVPQMKASFDAQRAKDREEGYKVPTFDEDGEPTGHRIKTVRELELEAAQQDKAAEESLKDNPHALQAYRKEAAWQLYHRKKDLFKAEEADRVQVATDFVGGNAQSQIAAGQAAGMDPDQIVENLYKQAEADATLLAPNVTRNQITQGIITNLGKQIEAGDVEAVRALAVMAEGSPNRAGGVTPLGQHPKTAKKMNAMLKRGAYIWAKRQSETDATIQAKEYIAAAATNKPTPVVSDITKTVGGQTYTIKKKDQLKAIAIKVEQQVLTNGNGEFVTEKDPAIINNRLVEVGLKMPQVVLPHLKAQVVGFTVKKGEQIDARDPAWQKFRSAGAAMLRVPGGKTMLRRYAPDYMVAVAELDDNLRRAGIENPEERTSLMNNYLSHASAGAKLRMDKESEKVFKAWDGSGLSKKGREIVANTVRMKYINRDDYDTEELSSEINRVAEEYKSQNPSMNGRSYPVPIDTVLPDDVFQAQTELRVNEFMQDAIAAGVLKKSDKVYLKRMGSSYAIYDAKDDTPMYNPTTGKMMRIKRSQIEDPWIKSAQEEAKRKKAEWEAGKPEREARKRVADQEYEWEEERRKSYANTPGGQMMAEWDVWWNKPEFTDPTLERIEQEEEDEEARNLEEIMAKNEAALKKQNERHGWKAWADKANEGR